LPGLRNLWKLKCSITDADRIHLAEDKACRFGEAMAAAIKTLLLAFCGPVRDPFLKRHSQYKIYE